VLFCHGTPRDDDEVVLVDTRLDKWTEALAGVPTTSARSSAAHAHALRAAGRPPAGVNAGSLGMPYGSVGSAVGPPRRRAVTLRRSAYDIEAPGRHPAACKLQDVDEWTDEYSTRATPTSPALAAFGPRDGRRDDPNPERGCD